jgi:hypothetical protein
MNTSVGPINNTHTKIKLSCVFHKTDREFMFYEEPSPKQLRANWNRCSRKCIKLCSDSFLLCPTKVFLGSSPTNSPNRSCTLFIYFPSSLFLTSYAWAKATVELYLILPFCAEAFSSSILHKTGVSEFAKLSPTELLVGRSKDEKKTYCWWSWFTCSASSTCREK